ncbi:MAG TPA: TMEM175 family protein [Solirubrobacterales bacterium]|nr:TMEM175 family protein [Solirubrobacterales bacterium]
MSRREAAKRREDNEVEFSRIVAFSDGVFAIAITLLVLGLGIPAHLADGEVAGAIGDQWDNFLAFAISFAVIGRFWLVHHRFFGEVRAFDGRLLALNMLYLGSIVLIPFSSQVLGEYGGVTASIVLYAANLAAVVLIGLWLIADAHHAGLTNADAATQREAWIRACYIAAVFLASIPVAFLAPTVAPFMWLVLFLDPSSRIVERGAAGSR